MALLEWQNLVFVLPMLAALLYVLLMASGLAVGGHGDLDLDHGIDVGVDHDVDVGVDHDVDADHDIAAAGHGGGFHVLGAALTFLGVGRVPLSILMMSLCIVWGAAGLVLNALLGPAAIVKVLWLAALIAFVGTRLLAEGLATILPREESYYTPKEDLVGETGEVLYEVTPASGTVRLVDPSGNLLDLNCRSVGESSIRAGTRVVLEQYDPSADVFVVHGCDA